MEINYQETSKDLLTRIDIHEKYGSANIDQWTTDLLKPQAGMDILDIGCGAGKLCFLFDDYTKGGAKITGGDFSEELLDKARARNRNAAQTSIFNFWILTSRSILQITHLTSAPAPSRSIMLQTWTLHLGRLHRVLKPGGRLFVSGPLPENKQMFYDIIKEATNATIPPMPGSSRFKGDIFNTIDRDLCKD